MGRLIDEDVLMERLGFLNTPREREENAGQIITLEDFDSIQTAYDVDKVVEELKEVHKNFCTSVTCGGKAMCKDCEEYVMFQKNIEIVKQGGVSDDVCEWKLEDEEANLYVTKCQQRHLIFEGTPKDNGYTYCPYCSKKIRI